MKLADKQQAVILMAGIIMLTGFGGLRYVPMFRQKQALAQTRETQQQQLEEIEKSSSMLPELRQRKSQLSESFDQFVRKIPKGKEFASLWQQIADAMNNCRLSDQWLQPGAEIKIGRLGCIPLTIECKGSMDQVFQFVRMLEGMDRLIRIEEITLENGSEFDANLKLAAKVNVYYQPESQNGNL